MGSGGKIVAGNRACRPPRLVTLYDIADQTGKRATTTPDTALINSAFSANRYRTRRFAAHSLECLMHSAWRHLSD